MRNHPPQVACTTPLKDGDIVFIKANNFVYAVKILQQLLVPEQATYQYVKLGTNSEPIEATTTAPFPDGNGLMIDSVPVAWSGSQIGQGFIYLTSRYLHAPLYEVGVPFFRGDLKNYSQKVPANVVFESVP